MKSYTFSLKFQNEINYLSQPKLVADIKSNLLHPASPGFGRNVKKIKKIQMKGNEVKISVTLLFDISDKEAKASVEHLRNYLIKDNYKLSIDHSKTLNLKKSKYRNKKNNRKKSVKKRKVVSRQNVFSNLFF